MNWPDRARYCVHIFECDAVGTPHEVAVLFRPTLAMHNGSRLRRSGTRRWWTFDAGSWWAKAHDRAFDCQEKWAGVGLREATV